MEETEIPQLFIPQNKLNGGNNSNMAEEAIEKLSIRIYLFENVTNFDDLQQKLRQQQLPISLLNPELIPSLFIVKIAALKAIQSYFSNSMRSRNLQTEVLYNLSPSRSFGDAFNNFGIKKSENTVILAVLFSNLPNFTEKDLKDVIIGNEVNVNLLSNYFNLEKAKKVYNISDVELNSSNIESAICSRIAIRDL